ncbi:helix-turn-helix domain-containing protein [Tenacibaculum amylolyticum]|uniref:helix-turn-helix domain-containing protein n=1 Tax=Tenacibaculum amylolyticum TaxID=104269 RepID=UPI0038B5397F
MPHLINTNESLFLLYGLLLFLYIRNLLHRRLIYKKSDVLFFLPFIVSLLVYLPYFFKTAAEKLSYYNAESGIDFSEEIWEWLFYFLVNIYFLWKALETLNVFNFNQKKQLSDVENSNLLYTSKLIKVCIILFCLEFVLVYISFLGFKHFEEIYLILNFLNGIVFLLIALDAVVHSKYILEDQNSLIALPILKEEENETNKYAKSSLTEISSKKIKTILLEFMENEKPYLTPKLRIKDLSELTNIPAHHISQVINESFQQNFYEFINAYRIKEAVLLLKDPKLKEYTYESIAYDVGFNSRSAFYTAFKKIYNTTPTKYLKK